MNFDKIYYSLNKINKYEIKLSKYGGYRGDQILLWKNCTGLNWKITKIILEQLKIINSKDIRDIFREKVEENRELFDSPNTYFTSFGLKGKSGDVVLYDFSHTFKKYAKRIVNEWDIGKLPQGSTIIFFDDLIGTGSQSVEYIDEKINHIIKPSFQCYLFSICATSSGVKKLVDESNFKILVGSIVDDLALNMQCGIGDKEIEMVEKAGECLKIDPFNKRLLLAFSYGIPNNSLPILWKDKYKYKDSKGSSQEWLALLPRSY